MVQPALVVFLNMPGMLGSPSGPQHSALLAVLLLTQTRRDRSVRLVSVFAFSAFTYISSSNQVGTFLSQKQM